MASNQASMVRRQRERERQLKRKEKQARKAERREEKKARLETRVEVADPKLDPDIDWSSAVRETEVVLDENFDVVEVEDEEPAEVAKD